MKTMTTRRLLQLISMLVLAVLACCSKENTQDARYEFNALTPTTVTQKSVTLTCTFSGEARISDSDRAGLAWGEKGSAPASWQRSYNVSVTGNRITGTATGLKPGTDYSACCFIELGSGRQILSETVDFTTPKSDSEVVDPTFTFKLQTSNITASGATLNASVSGTGAAATEMGFCYAMDNARAEQGYEATLSYTTVKVDPTPGEKQTVLSGLAGGGYIWYFYAVADGKRYQSAYVRFSTASEEVELPEFTGLSSSNLTASSVKLECDVEYDGREPISAIEFRISDGRTTQSKSVSAGVGHRSASFTGLAASTEYTWYAVATVNGSEARSSSLTFTTLAASTPSGKVYRTGWYELPEEQSGTKLYFAYHMRPDAPKVRNYSICYSAELHCAVWAAAAMHSSWDGNAGRNDTWQYDPEIPSSVQPDLSSSYKGGSYSRGHMIASSDRQVSVATNRQTFYYTNMAPQVQNEFNGGIWNKLEVKVQDTWTCSDTLYVVTGAHFANRSKTTKDKDGNTCYVPTHFYKVLLRSKSGKTRKPVSQLSADELQCVGFWFDHFGHGTKDQPSKSDMRSVADIEKETGLKFFPNVPNAPKTTYKASDWGM